MHEQRVLIISHGHPEAMRGGGEIAAHQMFAEMRERAGLRCFFVGAVSPAPGPVFSRHDEDDFFFHSEVDAFYFRQKDWRLTLDDFPEMLLWARPDVVHFHHYHNLGVELLAAVRRTLPHCRIVVTLHEYLAICLNNGQMIKRQTNELCYRASPAACSKCFPERSTEEIFLRRYRLLNAFQYVDAFISPSHFLKKRYVDWGLDADRISVIENGQDEAEPLPPRPLRSSSKARGRFAFFGQINPYKGVDVLLEAMKLIPEELRMPGGPISLAINGANLQHQPPEFQQRVQSLLDDLSDCVFMRGTYRPEDMAARMANVDWVVVPSIWWENSPLVIQEAQKFGRPLIVSGIGGMAEKVGHGVNGLHVRPGDPASLAEVMMEAALDEGVFESCLSFCIKPPSLKKTVDETLALYESLRAQGSDARETLASAAL